MYECYYCERKFEQKDLSKKDIYDRVLQQTITADVCEECVNSIDDGLENNFNQEFN